MTQDSMNMTDDLNRLDEWERKLNGLMDHQTNDATKLLARDAIPALIAMVRESKRERDFWKAERDRIRAFLSEGDQQILDSEQAWKRRATAAETEIKRLSKNSDVFVAAAFDLAARTAKGPYNNSSIYDSNSPYYGYDMNPDRSEYGRGKQHGRSDASIAVQNLTPDDARKHLDKMLQEAWEEGYKTASSDPWVAASQIMQAVNVIKKG